MLVEDRTGAREQLHKDMEIWKYLDSNPSSDGARILGRLVAALAEKGTFSFADLYRLNYQQLTLALDLLPDWRLDRYYAARIRLFDVVLNEVFARDDGAPPA